MSGDAGVLGTLGELEDALLENLAVRGVLTRLRAALQSEIAVVLRGDGDDERVVDSAFMRDPDTALVDALVAEYLNARCALRGG